MELPGKCVILSYKCIAECSYRISNKFSVIVVVRKSPFSICFGIFVKAFPKNVDEFGLAISKLLESILPQTPSSLLNVS